MKKVFSFIIILFVSTLPVISQEQNGNLNMNYRSIKTYEFDEKKKDWILIDTPESTIKFNIMDSAITVNDTVFKILSIRKKDNKKEKSMEYFFVLLNKENEFIDAEFHQYWYDNKRYDPQFIIKDRAYDLK